MGVFDSLLGGSNNVDIFNRNQEFLINDLTKKVRQNIGVGAPVYQGEITPGATSYQNQTFDRAGSLFGNMIDSSGAVSRLISGDPAFTVDPADREAYYQSAVVNPSMRQFQNDILPLVDSRYGDTWGTAGGHREAVLRAGTDLTTNMGGILGDLVYKDVLAGRDSAERGLDRIATGIGAGATAAAANTNILNSILGIGDFERRISAQQNSEDYNKWLSGQDYANPWLGFIGPALTQTHAQQQVPGLLGPIMGLVGAGIGGIAGGPGGAALGANIGNSAGNVSSYLNY